MSKSDQLRALREGRLKSSEGGVEGHAESRQGARKGSTVDPFDSGMLNSEAGIKLGPSDSKPRGRPLAKDSHKSLERTKPWDSEGMSRRTWYRRRAEGKAK